MDDNQDMKDWKVRVILAVFCLVAGYAIEKTKQELAPKLLIEFYFEESPEHVGDFGIIQYGANWSQETAEVHMETGRLITAAEATPELLAAYSQVIRNRGDESLCVDGQELEPGHCLKCYHFDVSVVPCDHTPHRSTYLVTYH